MSGRDKKQLFSMFYTVSSFEREPRVPGPTLKLRIYSMKKGVIDEKLLKMGSRPTSCENPNEVPVWYVAIDQLILSPYFQTRPLLKLNYVKALSLFVSFSTFS